MKNKILLGLIAALILLVAISAVSADENVNVTDDVLSDEGMILSDEEDEDTPQEPIKSNSTITASDAVGYETFQTKFTVKLTSDGKNLAGKQVNITINNVVYKKTTDNSGQASVNVKLNKGEYKVSFAYAGDDNTTPAFGMGKITIKAPTKTQLKVADKDINYRQGSKCLFMVRLLDGNGKAVKNQQVTFKVNGKTYSAKTDSKGYAKIYVNLKKGTHTIKYSFSKTAPYLSSSGSYKIKVKVAMGKGNGYWVWASHMKKVNLKTLSKKGTKQIFLHVQSLSLYGKSAVVKWIKKAHKYGMKVHLWMQVCYSGGKWVRPVNKDGSFRYSFMNKKIKEAVKYSKIKGVDGVHLDYVRFGGTAHLYKTSTDAINYLTKKASVSIHKAKSNSIVSAAIMPEPEMMDYYYGQDVSTMSKYVDVLLPMVYKGNYGKNTAWIKSVTKKFTSQSNGAQIWTGLQAYKSDSNPKKLSSSELLKDARAAKQGGATGVILFRFGISNFLNFKKV